MKFFGLRLSTSITFLTGIILFLSVPCFSGLAQGREAKFGINQPATASQLINLENAIGYFRAHSSKMDVLELPENIFFFKDISSCHFDECTIIVTADCMSSRCRTLNIYASERFTIPDSIPVWAPDSLFIIVEKVNGLPIYLTISKFKISVVSNQIVGGEHGER